MTHGHIGEFGRWRLAVQRAIFNLSAANTIVINTIVTRPAAVALALCGSVQGLQSSPLTVCTELLWGAAGKR